MTDRYARTARTRLKRLPARASYDRAAVHAVLDAALIAHVGYLIDGRPFVTPTAHWRDGEHLYWHGGASGRMLAAQREGADVCVTVSLLDGIVFARSAFHHSMNYRSVMAFGRAELVTDAAEKRRQLDLFMDRLAAGRRDRARPPTARELRLTSVARLPLEEVVLKSRSGPPKDDAADMAVDVWAGVLPIAQRVGAPQAAPDLAEGIGTPPGLRRLRLG